MKLILTRKFTINKIRQSCISNITLGKYMLPPVHVPRQLVELALS